MNSFMDKTVIRLLLEMELGDPLCRSIALYFTQSVARLIGHASVRVRRLEKFSLKPFYVCGT